MGGCLFGNTALAALHARAVHGVSRLAVVDWDAHHGNGTQVAFFEDPDVLTISLHQAGLLPAGVGQGRGGTGVGTNINIPLPPGSGTGAFAAAFERVVVPALERHEPELVLVACGFDSSAWDAHARLMLHSTAYRELTRALLGVADRYAKGRLVVIQEGGYAPAYTPFCGIAVLEELSGVSTGVEDPFLPIFEGYGYQELQPHQEAVIAAAEAAARAGGGDMTLPPSAREGPGRIVDGAATGSDAPTSGTSSRSSSSAASRPAITCGTSCALPRRAAGDHLGGAAASQLGATVLGVLTRLPL